MIYCAQTLHADPVPIYERDLSIYKFWLCEVLKKQNHSWTRADCIQYTVVFLLSYRSQQYILDSLVLILF